MCSTMRLIGIGCMRLIGNIFETSLNEYKWARKKGEKSIIGQALAATTIIMKTILMEQRQVGRPET